MLLLFNFMFASVGNSEKYKSWLLEMLRESSVVTKS
jgi:hypothetical protein